ncbi:probable flavin-containing monooxygenase 1 [Rutidosis leptorrhynchoides]|uniref:probable flavin-containing monooxygenase 1 n=1 Tax=Rutidosis leptorrhynchoides TaxID=125765 RepID=UPI003A995D11
MQKKQIAIVGAGISGLLACKYCLSKGFNPIVFDSESEIGGVWIKTIETTRLQLPKPFFQFSDFPWPESVIDEFPTQQQTLDYIRSYATHFDLIPRIKLQSRVTGISYDGPVLDTSTLWNGTGEPFPAHGKWSVTFENTKTGTTQIYTMDFVILCLGKFKDIPNMPKFPAGKGPDVFKGQAIHAMEYAAMDNHQAVEFVKGKKVIVVGFGKSGVDIARECMSINGTEHPCTILFTRNHWPLLAWNAWGIPIMLLYFNRVSQLMFHKPGEGFLLSLVATLLSPLRWGVSKLVESEMKKKFPLSKFDMVPQQSFSKDLRSSLAFYIPDPHDFFDALKKGNIKLKKSPSYSFYDKGILCDHDNTQIEADVVIFATGFRGEEKLKDIFQSKMFAQLIGGSPRLPLYRECIHPQFPQLAIIGFSDCLSNLFISEMRSRWLTTLLEGAFKLPSIKDMQKDVAKWDKYMKESCGEYEHRSSITTLEIWYNDQLCKDMGMKRMRKKGLWANLFEPYGPMDYA